MYRGTSLFSRGRENSSHKQAGSHYNNNNYYYYYFTISTHGVTAGFFRVRVLYFSSSSYYPVMILFDCIHWLSVLVVVLPSVLTDEVKIGVILPFSGDYSWILPKTRPAIEYARESVMNDLTLLPGYDVTFVIKDSKCSATYGPLAAIDMYEEKSAHVFLGPNCKFAVAPIALYTSVEWDIPIISAGALVTEFQNKDQYKLLTRIMGPHEKAGEFLLKLFKRFKWDLIGMIFHDFKSESQSERSECFFTLETIFLVLQKLTYPDEPWYTNFDETDPRTDYDDILRTASKKVRSEYSIFQIKHPYPPPLPKIVYMV